MTPLQLLQKYGYCRRRWQSSFAQSTLAAFIV